MMSGADALSNIDVAVRQARGELAALHKAIEASSSELLAQDAEEAEAYRALARLRLGELSEQDLPRRLERLAGEVRGLLGQRSSRMAEQGERLAKSLQAQEHLEAEREQQRRAVEAVRARIDEATAATQARLASDKSYEAQRAEAAERAQIAERARRKTEVAVEDFTEKREPYEADGLFMYLWERGYGTSRYRAWPLTRWLDGLVARLCGFEEARRNYDALTGIPKRLAEHAEQAEAAATAESEKVEALERAALSQDGVDALTAELGREETSLAALDEKIAQAEAAHLDLVEEQERFAALQDDDARQAVETFAVGLRRDDLASLRRDAEATATREDDALVQRLAAVAAHRDELRSDIERRRQALGALKARLAELEQVRRDFKNRGLDSEFSQFGDRDLLAALLGGLAGSMLSQSGFWAELGRQHRYRPRRSLPDFGGGPWSRGGGGFPGFRTGGRGGPMGGGGFRTGGTF